MHKVRTLVFLLASMIFLSVGTYAQPAVKTDLICELMVPAAGRYSIKGRIPVAGRITNNGQKRIGVYGDAMPGWFLQVIAKDRKGEIIPSSHVGMREDLGNLDADKVVFLDPGESFGFDMPDVRMYYQVNSPGMYEVSAVYLFSHLADETLSERYKLWEGEITSNAVQIEITND